MAALIQHLSKIRSPFGGEKVFKDECVYCFDTPECETGLYVCMNRFLGFGKRHVDRYFSKTGNAVFLHTRRIRKEIPKAEDDPPTKKPTRLAIGVEGGFDVDDKKYDIEEKNCIVVLPEWTEIALDDPDLPGEVQIAAAAIMGADSAAKQEELAAMAGMWDGEKRIISKYAENLNQLENGKKIPPSGWKCEKCDKVDNLWLNLTDGSILCGRKFWDGTGGNNHAVDHYEQVKYPLAVKLGTITPTGADVFSYDEDDMVLDPHLSKHLSHWGIDIMQMQKTDKTMTELEIEGNQRIGEWDVIQEAGSKLVPVYGPGYTGMRNLGNSCYMNSVMQVLFTIPDFVKRYYDPAQQVFDNAAADSSQDFNVQMCKLACGLLSGDYSQTPPPRPENSQEPFLVHTEGIRPQMFKTLIGKGHAEFSTKRQQDAQEYMLHLLNIIERNSRGGDNPSDCIKFQTEDRIECVQSKKVKYTHRDDFMLAIPIPIEAAVNKQEVSAYEAKKREFEAQKKHLDPKELVRPCLPLQACIEALSQPEFISDFYSTAINANTTAKKTTRLSTFPDYLFIQLKKFTLGDDWVPKKLDVSVDMPDDLDLTSLRGSGKQPTEEELPENTPSVTIDEGIVSSLVEMGFAPEGCKKAVYHTQSSGVEPAMNWVMEHMGDPDFADPFHIPGTAQKMSDFTPNEDALVMIMSMGFTRDQSIKALKATDNNVERAADWIFSHAAELDQPMETGQAAGDTQNPQSNFRDGSGKYKLLAFISHMGTSTMVGHYVCHILKEGRWIIFNDEKVAYSEKPPKDLGYIYLYQRV